MEQPAVDDTKPPSNQQAIQGSRRNQSANLDCQRTHECVMAEYTQTTRIQSIAIRLFLGFSLRAMIPKPSHHPLSEPQPFCPFFWRFSFLRDFFFGDSRSPLPESSSAFPHLPPTGATSVYAGCSLGPWLARPGGVRGPTPLPLPSHQHQREKMHGNSRGCT